MSAPSAAFLPRIKALFANNIFVSVTASVAKAAVAICKPFPDPV